MPDWLVDLRPSTDGRSADRHRPAAGKVPPRLHERSTRHTFLNASGGKVYTPSPRDATRSQAGVSHFRHATAISG